jgi:hypothetical protein
LDADLCPPHELKPAAMKRYLSNILVLSLLVVGVASTLASNDCHGRTRGLPCSIRDALSDGRELRSSSSSSSSFASFSQKRAPLPANVPGLLHHVPRGGGLAASNKLASSKPAKTQKAQAAVATPATPTVSPLRLRLKIGFYFGLWYALNIYYNSYVSFSLAQ